MEKHVISTAIEYWWDWDDDDGDSWNWHYYSSMTILGLKITWWQTREWTEYEISETSARPWFREGWTEWQADEWKTHYEFEWVGLAVHFANWFE